MAEDKKGEPFTITDKRRFVVDDSGGVKPEGTEETRKAPEASETAREEPQTTFFQEGDVVPDIDFATFILSLSSSAILHLGLMENPYTGKTEKNLSLAKQTIDIISMLKDKTKGNLSHEEENLITHLLTDLRFKYVNEVSKK